MALPSPYLGWSVSRLGRFRDIIGPAHLLYLFAGSVYSACGTRARLGGELHPDPPDYAHGVCRRCAAALKRRGASGLDRPPSPAL